MITGNIGNYVQRLHMQASKPEIVFRKSTVRNCYFGKHLAEYKGGKMVGRHWCCAKCSEVV
jgi:hypothetical protein